MKKFDVIYPKDGIPGERYIQIRDDVYIRYPLERSTSLVAITDMPVIDANCLVLVHVTDIDDLISGLQKLKGDIRRDTGTYDLGAV